MHKLTLKAVFAVILFAAISNSAMAQYLYRYKDENGITVMNNFIPAGLAGNGYEVLDASTGKVVETVEPVEGKEETNVVYLSPDDRILLASYSTVEEIQAHLERKTVGLKAEIANIQTDLRILGFELEEKRAELLKLQEREKEIPEDLTAHIAELEESDQGLNDALARRQTDLDLTSKEYEAKMKRFEVLLNSELK